MPEDAGFPSRYERELEALRAHLADAEAIGRIGRWVLAPPPARSPGPKSCTASSASPT
jgi:hypothetical protein